MRRVGPLGKLYMALVFALIYAPIVLVVIYSFNDSDSSTIWSGFTLRWYAAMPNDVDLLSSLWVSIRVAVISAGIASVVGTLGAVALYSMKRRVAQGISGISYIPLIIPEVVLGVALLMFFSSLPVTYGEGTLILSHLTFCIPYVLFMVQVRLAGMDPAIKEAAADLGASPIMRFLTITLPLISPAVISGALLAAAMSLDDVVISLFMAGPGTTTLPIKIFSMLKLGVTPRINALCSIMLLLTFLITGIASYIMGRAEKGR